MVVDGKLVGVGARKVNLNSGLKVPPTQSALVHFFIFHVYTDPDCHAGIGFVKAWLVLSTKLTEEDTPLPDTCKWYLLFVPEHAVQLKVGFDGMAALFAGPF